MRESGGEERERCVGAWEKRQREKWRERNGERERERDYGLNIKS